jgi:hypothetical protein
MLALDGVGLGMRLTGMAKAVELVFGCSYRRALENKGDKKLVTTAPVTQTATTARMDITAPVTQAAVAGGMST